MSMRFRRGTDSAVMEAFSAGSALLFGAFLVLPGDTFSRGRNYYDLMAQVAPEMLWGFVFVLMGGLQIYALHKHCKMARLAMCLVAFAAWTYLSVPVIWQWPTPAVVAPIICLSGSMFWAFVRRSG